MTRIKDKIKSGFNWLKNRSRKFWVFLSGVIFVLTSGGLMVNELTGAPSFVSSLTDKSSRYEMSITQVLQDSGKADVFISKTEPRVSFRKWDGAVNMQVYYDGLSTIQKLPDPVTGILVDRKVNPVGVRASRTDRVEWKTADIEMHTYPLPAGEGMEDGGFEIDIVLKKKPKSNVFDFQITGWEDLNFFYQPTLTQEEIDEGTFRPDNVIGSYAVYHKFLANHRKGSTNYAVGKVYHIFRPKVIDALGFEVWGELSYIDGVLSVTVDQTFLDTATYPVRVDPVFGYTALGASDSSNGDSNANVAAAYLHTA